MPPRLDAATLARPTAIELPIMRSAIFCVAVALLAATTACRDRSTPAPTAASTTTTAGARVANATLDRVIDGDTIDVTVDGTKERVRLIGIDTPETKKEDTPIECFGPEASAFTESLLPEGIPLYLERDIEPRDIYGRLLAYVYLANDGTFVNLAIISGGYARLLTFPPNVAHVDDFIAAQRVARTANIGLWAGCTG